MFALEQGVLMMKDSMAAACCLLLRDVPKFGTVAELSCL
jgi:hypothetical protein